MKKHCFLNFLIVLVCITGCTHEEIPENKLLYFTATMSGNSEKSGENEDVGTRIALEQDDLDILLTWEEGDKLELCIVYGDKKLRQVTDIINISEDGRKADFTVTIPDDITDRFDLYGVYGGGGLSTIEGEENIALLPDTPWSGSSLSDMQNKDIVMLTFEEKDINSKFPNRTVTFRHLGSLFMIQLKNTGSGNLNNIQEANLTAATTIWGHKSSDGAKYNIVTGEFVNGTTLSDNNLPLYRLPANLSPGGVLSFWGWYPPVKDKIWPIINLKVNANGRDFITSVPKGSREVSTGKAYYFYATLDGTALSFANRANASASKYLLADQRDGNVYRTVTLGEQTWMAENLRYLPEVVGPGTGSSTIPYYYVYDYNGTNVTAAKASSRYSTYGVLYNWPAASQGSASSSTNPSGVRGICPTGWHLPSESEWKQLEEFLIANGYNYDGTFEYNKIAKSLAVTSGWQLDNKEGVPGNTNYGEYRNKSGFSALASGFRRNTGFTNSSFSSHWFSTTESSWGTIITREVWWMYSYLYDYSANKDNGISVRCVKDNNTDPVFKYALNLNSSTSTGGVVSGSGSYEEGSSVIISVSANYNYAFTGWTGDTHLLASAKSATTTLIMPAKDVNLTANYTDTFTDSRDGSVYKYKSIGGYTWMAENLKYLPTVSKGDQGSQSDPHYYVYNYNSNNVEEAKATSEYNNYGVLYNWPAAMQGAKVSNSFPSGVRGVCPEGWHLPSMEEWNVLINSTGGISVAGNKLKATGTVSAGTGLWILNQYTSDEFGFSAVPGGVFIFPGNFATLGSYCEFWSTTQSELPDYIYKLNISANNSVIYINFHGKANGHSIRCVRDF